MERERERESLPARREYRLDARDDASQMRLLGLGERELTEGNEEKEGGETYRLL